MGIISYFLKIFVKEDLMKKCVKTGCMAFFAIIFFMFVFNTGAFAQLPLVFQDDFTTPGIDSTKWTTQGNLSFTQPGDGFLHFSGSGTGLSAMFFSNVVLDPTQPLKVEFRAAIYSGSQARLSMGLMDGLSLSHGVFLNAFTGAPFGGDVAISANTFPPGAPLSFLQPSVPFGQFSIFRIEYSAGTVTFSVSDASGTVFTTFTTTFTLTQPRVWIASGTDSSIDARVDYANAYGSIFAGPPPPPHLNSVTLSNATRPNAPDVVVGENLKIVAQGDPGGGNNAVKAYIFNDDSGFSIGKVVGSVISLTEVSPGQYEAQLPFTGTSLKDNSGTTLCHISAKVFTSLQEMFAPQILAVNPVIKTITPNVIPNPSPVSFTIDGNNFNDDHTIKLQKTGSLFDVVAVLNHPVAGPTTVSGTFNSIEAYGVYDVVATKSCGANTVNHNGFTVGLSPTVSSVEPCGAPAVLANYHDYVDITITGVNFNPASTVTLFNQFRSAHSCTSLMVVGSTTMKCTIDLDGFSPVDYDVVVTNPNGTTGKGTFSVYTVGYAAQGFPNILRLPTKDNIEQNFFASNLTADAGYSLDPGGYIAFQKVDSPSTQFNCSLTFNSHQLGADPFSTIPECIFNLASAPPGWYNLFVKKNSCSIPEVLSKAVKVYSPSDTADIFPAKTPWFAVRVGHTADFTLSVANIDSGTAFNVVLTDYVPPQMTILDVKPPCVLINTPVRKIQCGFDSVGGGVGAMPYAYKTIFNAFRASIPSTLPLGLCMVNKLSVTTTTIDSNLSNNTNLMPIYCGGSFDPNNKTVIPQGFITVNDNLRYIINFENEGNLDALNIAVQDTLDNNLDPKSFDFGDPFSYDEQARVMTWAFPDIHLPPQGTGSVWYTVRPKANLPIGTVIHNKASVYFDINPPIDTPETVNIIGAPETVATQNQWLEVLLLKQDIATLTTLPNLQGFLAKLDAVIAHLQDAMNLIQQSKKKEAKNRLKAAREELEALEHLLDAQQEKKLSEETAKAFEKRIETISEAIEKIEESLEGKKIADNDKNEKDKKLSDQKLNPNEGMTEKLFVYPTPSRDGTLHFSYRLTPTGKLKARNGELQVTIDVYTVSGKTVTRLMCDAASEGCNFTEQLSNGVYIYRMTIKDLQGKTETKVGKVVVIK